MGVQVVADGTHQGPFAKYSMRDQLEQIERYMAVQTAVLNPIALAGQATCIYAAPSSGKTLITLRLVMDSVSAGKIKADRVWYLNMDDNSVGLVEKLRMVNEYGIQMMADGHQGFGVSVFLKDLVKIVDAGAPTDAILILDTLKKFVDTMQKSEVRKFTSIVRRFVALGGTVIALSHTNKNQSADGKWVYAGTSDVVDDFDCVYIASKVTQADRSRSVVVFENKKSRGRVPNCTAFEFAEGESITYAEKLASVREIDPEQWKPLIQSNDAVEDGDIVTTVMGAIKEGFVQKMALAAEVSKRTGASRQRVVRVIEKYSPPFYPPFWTFTRKERGAHHYALVDELPVASSS